MRDNMSFIITRLGKKFYPLDPKPEEVDVWDIASHLSKIARWTGATKFDDGYSVAQHAVICSNLAHPMYALEALHHDSSEAYLADIARPVKRQPGFNKVYTKYENKLMSVIHERFGLRPWKNKLHPLVRMVDDRMLATEARDLMNAPWEVWEESGVTEQPYTHFRIHEVWSAKDARVNFLKRHEYLMEQRKMYGTSIDSNYYPPLKGDMIGKH